MGACICCLSSLPKGTDSPAVNRFQMCRGRGNCWPRSRHCGWSKDNTARAVTGSMVLNLGVHGDNVHNKPLAGYVSLSIITLSCTVPRVLEALIGVQIPPMVNGVRPSVDLVRPRDRMAQSPCHVLINPGSRVLSVLDDGRSSVLGRKNPLYAWL